MEKAFQPGAMPGCTSWQPITPTNQDTNKLAIPYSHLRHFPTATARRHPAMRTMVKMRACVDGLQSSGKVTGAINR
jgi:hypothetical protein